MARICPGWTNPWTELSPFALLPLQASPDLRELVALALNFGPPLDLDEINGSFIEKVIAWAAGGSQATSATKERFLLDVKDNPQRFMSHVESSISNLQSEIGQTMKGAS